VAAKIALVNILDNALKFSPAGGHVEVTVETDQREAVIAVADSGPGVAPEELPRLFQRFFRGHASRATGSPGVGLGLAIAHALVEGQGGRISVTAAASGPGATFSIHLPRV
jgi:two-component system OmpR family sensor kinase